FQDATISTEGVEVDIILSVTPNWEVLASGATLDYDRPDGTVPENAHKHTAALFSRYTFEGGRLGGLTIGGGFNWKSSAPIEDSNFVIADDYYTIDAFARYAWRDYELSFNISNLTNELYLNRAVNQNTIFYGPERLWKIKLTRRF
ncbi:MAG: TonB-dependent receptor domain-containing protein, partial [bacterium]